MENNTKLRILYLYRYLHKYTDPEHPKSTLELTKMLQEEYNMKVSRNTISNDLVVLNNCGLHIEVIHSTQNKYYYDGQLFQEAELKLLIDAVSSSKFITGNMSEALINKLIELVPPHSAIKLRSHVNALNQVKSDNEKGYYIVDAVNEAIDTKRKISFYYTDFDVYKTRIRTNNGDPYTVSPYSLIWDGDYYYLRGYCDEREAMRTFRLDRILETPTLLYESAIPKPLTYNIAEYNKFVFRMYDTDEPVKVALICKASLMKTIIDNFGMEVDTVPVNEECFEVNVMVCTSPTFYRWVFGFNGAIKIVSPDSVRMEYMNRLQKALEESR